ncbi:MAG: hypothetical protein ACI9XO_001569 [Paraglaciecola sp.]|jgi:hypothetical protein
MQTTDYFYSNLPLQNLSLSELLTDPSHFFPVPNDWFVVITDVKNSTNAVLNGQHETINLIATGSVIAVLNIAHKKKIQIPFFFGGDGATFMIPPNLRERVMANLKEYQQNTLKNFGLELRAGCVCVKEIYKNNIQLSIAKLQQNHIFSIPIVVGEGLIYADIVIKEEEYNYQDEVSDKPNLDLTGMECRWNKIKTPKKVNEVVCLIAVVINGNQNLKTYKKVIDCLDEIYGTISNRSPISINGLKLNPSIQKLKLETQVKLGEVKWLPLIKLSIITFLARLFYFKFDKDGKNYLQKLVQLSDTLVIDGRINTVISGTSNQRKALIIALEKLEEEGEILFGIHTSNESIMSCYVRDRKEDHIHFVDGSDGGYTMAARQLKQKLKL